MIFLFKFPHKRFSSLSTQPTVHGQTRPDWRKHPNWKMAIVDGANAHTHTEEQSKKRKKNKLNNKISMLVESNFNYVCICDAQNETDSLNV